MSTLKVDTIKSDTTPTVTISDGLSVSGVTTSTGDVSIADKIVHTGDTHTAIRFAGNDIITAEIGGNETFRIDSSGLKITDKLIHSGDTDTFLEFGTDTITADTGGTERLRIGATGKVGIATDNPYAPLSLKTGPAASNTSNMADKGILLHAPGATDEQIIPISASFVTNAHLPRCAMGFISHPTVDPIEGYAGEIGFYTRDGADGSAVNPADERMRITRSGNVGIGTDNPTAKLTVSSTGPSVCDIHHIDGGTNDEARIILGALAANPPSNRGAGIAAVNNGAGHDLIIKCSASHSVGPTEKFKIGSDGDVTISDGDLVIGTSGHGIDFSATSDAGTVDSEILSDYENGSWTPTCSYSVTLSTAFGYYTRIGHRVMIDMFLTVNNDQSNQTFEVNNLPFAGGNGYDLSVPAIRISSWDLPSGTLWVSGNSGGTYMRFQCMKDNANYVVLPADSGGGMIVSFTYEVA